MKNSIPQRCAHEQEKPLSRRLQAGNIFSSQMRTSEQNPCWYLPATAPRQYWGGMGARASCFHQGRPQQTDMGYSFGLHPKFQSLLWPCWAAIPIFGFLPEKAGTDPWRYLGAAASQEAAFRLCVLQDRINHFLISIPATEPCSAKPRRKTHVCNCTIKCCVNTAILSRRKHFPTIPWGLKDQCVFRQWMGLCLFSFSSS